MNAMRQYREKRDPERTNEPFSAERRSSGATQRGRFVVHLHAATRRHYDLRLEVGGALKSFAVPRGPSLDPADKRLAVNTEDHPIEYLEFEQVIPEGNYGAGAMIVWDAGRVGYLEGTAEEGVARGKIDFQLFGHKLRGRFGLIHTDGNQWLLVKKQDGYATGADVIANEPASVLSGLTVEQLAAIDRVVAELEAEAAALGARKGAVAAKDTLPMLCASEGATLEDATRLYELKLDGVRIVAERDGDRVDMRYRRQRPAAPAYPEIARALRALPVRRVVLDGEMVAFGDDGRPSFQRLAQRIHRAAPHDVARAAAEVPVSFLAFDLLALGPYDLRGLPLEARKRLLLRLLPGKGRIRALDHLDGDGRALWQFCVDNGLEGVVAKRRDAPYVEGPKRGIEWVKIKRQRDAEFVVTGWEESDKGRGLRSLCIASYVDGELVERGKVGSGLSDAIIAELRKRLDAIEERRDGKIHHVAPDVVVSVEFRGFSDGGQLWQPVFRGLREDVAPEACTAAPVEERVDAELDAPEAPPAASGRVALTNQDKVFWPDEGYTKGDLCRYYAAVSGALLPLLRDRPVVLVRYPDGIAGKNFYQWRVPRGTPEWLRSLELRDEDDPKGTKRSFLLDDVDALVHVANLGCIPLHVLAARAGSLEVCDFITIDFDLGGQPFGVAVKLALSLREVLDDVGMRGFAKTSGQSGMHVLVPVGPGIGFDAAKLLVELLGRIIEGRNPDVATMERRVEKRGGKALIDTGQTGRGRTIVAPYSVRAVPRATVSTPLHWDEVSAALDPGQFTMFTVPARLADLGDPMADLLEVKPDVPRAIAALERWTRRHR
jgi:bifunctional non-homologous end joining protein LigD